MMRNMFRTLAVCIALLGMTAPSFAATASSNMAVTANVVGTCTISALPLNFGNYDPAGAHASSPLDGTTSVTTQCTPGTTYQVGLDFGLHNSFAIGTNRSLENGASHLSYELFKDPARAQVWTNSGPGLLAPGIHSGSPTTFPVFGRISSGQMVPAGAYTDTVVATIFF